jgi:XTP/dITP diphosphohydrolase
VPPFLVLATANAGKVREIAGALDDLPLRILTLADFPDLVLPPEGSESYAENALAKVRTVAAATGRWALGDDSGLEVDALGGGPGIMSARYGGEGLGDAGRRHALLAAVAGVPPKERTARFRTLIALCQPGGREVIVEGTCEGVLAPASRGSGGFGYDPIFYYPPLEGTFGELSQRTKDVISARGVALARAREVLRRWLVVSGA